MMKRKSPIRHKVKAHKRKGNQIKSFERGRGQRVQRSRVVKNNIITTISKTTEVKLPSGYVGKYDTIIVRRNLTVEEKDTLDLWMTINDIQARELAKQRVFRGEFVKVLNDSSLLLKKYYIRKGMSDRAERIDGEIVRLIERAKRGDIYNGFGVQIDIIKNELHWGPGNFKWYWKGSDFQKDEYLRRLER